MRLAAPLVRLTARLTALFALCLAYVPAGHADAGLHCLWELHGRHNTVYLLGSIHVLRPQDYPLAPVVLDAYADSRALVMEINLDDIDSAQIQAEMLSSATLPEGKTLPTVLGARRYAHAESLAHDVGVDLSLFDSFAPWFAAEAISQTQLTQLGFQPQSGVEMYFLERAKADGKTIAGLETVHDQIALFDNLTLDAQAQYLVSSLEQAHELPQEVDALVRAWQRGDTTWFANEMASEFGKDPVLYASLLTSRNRKWISRIEALLEEDRNYLVIVGTGHLVGRDSVIALLKKDGIGATQR
jgi:uncharacterized protein YbaP (TraB family)